MSRMPCLVVLALIVAVSPLTADDCIDCHNEISPNIVADWSLSQHSKNDITCDICHGDGHRSAEDVDQVQLPTPDTCNECHPDQVKQFSSGKHAFAWAALNAMPT